MRPIDVHIHTVTTEYFDVLQIPVVLGRRFADSDRQTGPEQTGLNVIISAELGRLLGPSPIGAVLRTDGSDTRFHVIGVVGNVKQNDYGNPDIAAVYLLDATYSAVDMLIVRSNGSEPQIMEEIGQAVHRADHSALLGSAMLMSALVSRSIAAERFRAGLWTAFGAMALLLTSLGLTGSTSLMLESRERELYVRAVLGATGYRLASIVTKDVVYVIGLGVAVGSPLSLVLFRTSTRILATPSRSSIAVIVIAMIPIIVSCGVAALVPALKWLRRMSPEGARQRLNDQEG